MKQDKSKGEQDRHQHGLLIMDKSYKRTRLTTNVYVLVPPKGYTGRRAVVAAWGTGT